MPLPSSVRSKVRGPTVAVTASAPRQRGHLHVAALEVVSQVRGEIGPAGVRAQSRASCRRHYLVRLRILDAARDRPSGAQCDRDAGEPLLHGRLAARPVVVERRRQHVGVDERRVRPADDERIGDTQVELLQRHSGRAVEIEGEEICLGARRDRPEPGGRVGEPIDLRLAHGEPPVGIRRSERSRRDQERVLFVAGLLLAGSEAIELIESADEVSRVGAREGSGRSASSRFANCASAPPPTTAAQSSAALAVGAANATIEIASAVAIPAQRSRFAPSRRCRDDARILDCRRVMVRPAPVQFG